jgi:transposase
MKAISVEKRELIIEAKQRGEKEEEIAIWLKISKRSVGTIWKRFMDTGVFQPIKYTGRKSCLSNEKIDEICSVIKERSDITLHELIEQLSLPIKKSQLSKLLIRLGFSYKKTLHPKEQLRDDVQQKRSEWMKQQKNMNVNNLVFIDESGVNCGMTRLYGRSKKGERVNDYVPDVRFERTSIISSIRLDGTQAPFMYKGTLNGELFKGYINEVLSPTLKSGDVVIMDNLSSHKVSGVLDSIYEKNATVMFLPPYSPDLNPIEMSWSKMKSVLRKLKATTYDELTKDMRTALDSFTKSDIANWFSHDGYDANV